MKLPLKILLLLASCICLSKDKPNFIFMMADDMGIAEAEFYAYQTYAKTPELNKMAASGIKLNRFYAQAPVCSPTRFSCYTGRHPYRVGIWGANTGHLRYEEITLPEILKQNGYKTGHFGKWHLGQMVNDPLLGKGSHMHDSCPNKNGIDHYFAVHTSIPTFNPYGPDGKKIHKSNNPYYCNGQRVSSPLIGDSSKIMMDEALKFIEKSVAEQKPFMAYIWFNTPHTPIAANPVWQKTFEETVGKGWGYYSNIADMDLQVGRLRKELRRLQIEKNTLLFFASDNGPAKSLPAGPFSDGKASLFEGGIRVAGIAEWPGKISAGSESNAVTCTSDYLPTALAAAGIDYPFQRALDGENILPLLLKESDKRLSTLKFVYEGATVIMNEKYKAIFVQEGTKHTPVMNDKKLPTDQWILFDIEDDFKETQNIASNKPEIMQQFIKESSTWKSSLEKSFHGFDYGAAGSIYSGKKFKTTAKKKSNFVKKKKKK